MVRLSACGRRTGGRRPQTSRTQVASRSLGAAVCRCVKSSDNDNNGETKAAEIGVVGGCASTVTSRITSRCRAWALRTQETTWSHGTAVTNADKQGVGVGGSSKASAPSDVEGRGSAQLTGTGTTRKGAQVERGCCARVSRRRPLVESTNKA